MTVGTITENRPDRRASLEAIVDLIRGRFASEVGERAVTTEVRTVK